MSSQATGKEIILQSDSYYPVPSLKRERKIGRRLLTSSPSNVKLGNFASLSYSDGKEMYQKVRYRCKVIILLTKSTAFLLFSLHFKLHNRSALSDDVSGREGGGGGGADSFV